MTCPSYKNLDQDIIQFRIKVALNNIVIDNQIEFCEKISQLEKIGRISEVDLTLDMAGELDLQGKNA